MNEPTLLQHEEGKSSQKMSHQMINLKDVHPLFVFLYAIVELCKTGENHVDCKNEEITIPCPCLFSVTFSRSWIMGYYTDSYR